MEIATRREGNLLELQVKGELDNYWATHLAERLDEVIREDTHRVLIDLSDVTYLSSAGIGILVRYYKQLQSIQGSLAVSKASDYVKRMLALTKLDGVLIAQTTMSSLAAQEQLEVRRVERAGIVFEVFDVDRHATMRCRAVGDPELLSGCRFTEQHAHTVRFPESTLGIGLGAIGSKFDECRNRFGEFLAVAGAATYLPTHANQVPDYQLAAGTFVPEMQVLYGVICEGSFASFARFEAKSESGTIPLSELAAACLEVAGTDRAALVLVAESAGLVGASLRRSPAQPGSERAPFDFPAVREWLSFTPEHAYPRCMALVVGIASRRREQSLSALMRPLAAESGLNGHFHAAVFSYSPLRKGLIELKNTVPVLFESQDLQSVLHLLRDQREISGAGQSEFVRGACWVGPIPDVEDDRI
jgi:anti-anti-sigma factor